MKATTVARPKNGVIISLNLSKLAERGSAAGATIKDHRGEGKTGF